MKGKTLSALIIALLLAVFLLPNVSAHSGRTDANGGHYNRSTGEYHYHHGYPEHQHPGGVCPYETTNTDSDETNTSAPKSSRAQSSYASRASQTSSISTPSAIMAKTEAVFGSSSQADDTSNEAGGIIGAVIVLGGIVLVVCLLVNRRKKRQR